MIFLKKRKLANPLSAKIAGSIISLFLVAAMIAAIYLNLIIFDVNLFQDMVPHLMPIMVAIIGFFTVGYILVAMVTSRIFQNLVQKRPNYKHLEF